MKIKQFYGEEFQKGNEKKNDEKNEKTNIFHQVEKNYQVGSQYQDEIYPNKVNWSHPNAQNKKPIDNEESFNTNYSYDKKKKEMQSNVFHGKEQPSNNNVNVSTQKISKDYDIVNQEKRKSNRNYSDLFGIQEYERPVTSQGQSNVKSDLISWLPKKDEQVEKNEREEAEAEAQALKKQEISKSPKKKSLYKSTIIWIWFARNSAKLWWREL